ncbi:hypothetical protein [Paracoccus sp. (in: a-proteobacteria)]|uniref:hypothetical protein n=1 Tax=Paracoccus sp. TaxID=267 RepID=UPI00289AABF1|nr:hypothetical protein [Paracoccus sp. (in: a-proteobacteria)]
MVARFRVSRHGWIVDSVTGLYIVRVAVEVLDADTAHRIATTIITALHADFGPSNPA